MSWLSDVTGINIDLREQDPNDVVQAAGEVGGAVLDHFTPAPVIPSSAPKPASAVAVSPATFLKSPLAFGLSGGAVLALGVAAFLIFKES
jgi:hypothetical protein